MDSLNNMHDSHIKAMRCKTAQSRRRPAALLCAALGRGGAARSEGAAAQRMQIASSPFIGSPRADPLCACVNRCFAAREFLRSGAMAQPARREQRRREYASFQVHSSARRAPTPSAPASIGALRRGGLRSGAMAQPARKEQRRREYTSFQVHSSARRAQNPACARINRCFAARERSPLGGSSGAENANRFKSTNRKEASSFRVRRPPQCTF